jgi:hypothetical protein
VLGNVERIVDVATSGKPTLGPAAGWHSVVAGLRSGRRELAAAAMMALGMLLALGLVAPGTPSASTPPLLTIWIRFGPRTEPERSAAT